MRKVLSGMDYWILFVITIMQASLLFSVIEDWFNGLVKPIQFVVFGSLFILSGLITMLILTVMYKLAERKARKMKSDLGI